MKKFNLIGLLFFALISTLCLGQENSSTQILGRPTNHSVTLNVMFNDSAQFFCEYNELGNKTKMYTDTINCQWGKVGEIVIGNLQKNTQYSYRTVYRFSDSDEFIFGTFHNFRTQREENNAFKFVVFGDTHLGTSKHCNPLLYKQALQNAAEENPDLFFILGDDFRSSKMTSPSLQEIEQIFIDQRPFLSTLACSSPLFSIIGNHEMESGYAAYYLNETRPVFQTQCRKKHIPNPIADGFYTGNISEDSLVGNRESYYEFTWGDALFVVLDYYWYSESVYEEGQGGGLDWGTTIGNEQYFWLKQTLEKSHAKYKFVLAHHVLSTGRGGVAMATKFEWGESKNLSKNRPLWDKTIHQLLVDTDVTAFIQGHDHVFAREELDGVTYITAPFPGDALYETYNTEAFTGDVFGNSGHLSFRITSNDVVLEYVRSVLPADETDSVQNKTVSYSYSLVNKQVLNSITAVPNVSYSIKKAKIHPNPFYDSVSIDFTLESENKINILIYKLDGKLINKINAGYLHRGEHSFNWDGKKKNGANVKSGTYICKISSGDSVIVEKMIKIE